MMIRRGDIYYADLSPVVGSEQGGIRPVLVIQNNVGNRHSPTVICAAITSKMNKAKLPTHIEISTRDYKIVKNSVILWPVRVAVSGKASTPGGATELCALLGRDESLRRLRAAVDKLAAAVH